MSLVSLVYASLSAQKMSQDELQSILAVSRKNNTAIDVTGMLLYRHGFFIQVLEGEKPVIDDLYGKIRQDPRHRNVVTIIENEIGERAFGDWSMGFHRINDDAMKQIDGYSDVLTSDRKIGFFVNRPDRAARLLNAFRDTPHA